MAVTVAKKTRSFDRCMMDLVLCHAYTERSNTVDGISYVQRGYTRKDLCAMGGFLRGVKRMGKFNYIFFFAFIYFFNRLSRNCPTSHGE